jgi:hypothetical protein
MFEHHRQPIISRKEFFKRVAVFAIRAILLVSVAWFIGVLGYRFFEGMSWIDSILNSAMILGGMGQVNMLYTTGGKLFASFYAIFSGVVFLVSVAVFLAPVIHRLMHTLHVDDREWD